MSKQTKIIAIVGGVLIVIAAIFLFWPSGGETTGERGVPDVPVQTEEAE